MPVVTFRNHALIIFLPALSIRPRIASGYFMKFVPLVFILTAFSAWASEPTTAKTRPKGSPAQAKLLDPAQARKAKWDTTAIHKVYLEGDFDEAIDRCEAGLNYVAPLSHDDSVFIFKHLGVMYTSKYETREKGKGFMMRLLEVEPTARIMDMYASDMIYMIFKNIQDEYDLAQMKLKRAQALNNPQPKTGNTGDGKPEGNKPSKSGSIHWVPWTIAVVGVAGGAVLAANMISEKPVKKKENTIP